MSDFKPFLDKVLLPILGAHLETIARAGKAQPEADAARKEGRGPN